ncbi:MAG: helix-turn-helix domain-containing protein [Phycisphaerales bacterium]
MKFLYHQVMAKARKNLNTIPPLGLRVWSGRAGGMPVAHRHGDLELNFILSGRMTYLVGSSLVTLPPGRLCAIWGAAPHQMVRTDEPVRAMWVTVPLDEVMAWRLPEAWMGLLLKRGIVTDARPMAGDEAMLQRWAGDLKQGDAARRRIVQLELEARLRRMALAGDVRRRSKSQATDDDASGPSSRAVRLMAGYIAGHFRQDVSVEQIAGHVGLHPNYAMSLFRKHTGLTLNQYLTRSRVAEAQRLLLSSRRAVLDIACNSGFGSVSRFYEAFGRHVGYSPRRFRQRMIPSGTSEAWD